MFHLKNDRADRQPLYVQMVPNRHFGHLKFEMYTKNNSKCHEQTKNFNTLSPIRFIHALQSFTTIQQRVYMFCNLSLQPNHVYTRFENFTFVSCRRYSTLRPINEYIRGLWSHCDILQTISRSQRSQRSQRSHFTVTASFDKNDQGPKKSWVWGSTQ